jgi:GT2 family glycosyltransferase
MSSAAPRLICVVVNWNGYVDTIECLASLQLQDYPNLSVVVVDNGSSNDSAALIQAAHPWVTFHQLPVNLGFPSGCNAGTRIAYAQGADYIWLLNNDTVAPPGTASAIVRAAQANPGAGAIGCALYYMHAPTEVQAWGGGRINLSSAYVSHFHEPASFEPANTFFTGASLTLPRAICESVGIFYEGFFMYCDDSDLCLRIHRAGYPLVMALDTAILHKEGGSRPKESPFTDLFATTSTMRLLRRHAPVPAFSIAVYASLRLLNRVRRRQRENVAAVWEGIKVYFRERKRVFTDQL